MTVYSKQNSPFYHFDFHLRGRRFHGSTGCTTREEAERYEAGERTKAKKKVVRALQRTCALLQPPKRVVDPKLPLIGVYLLMLRRKVVYIGSSLNMPDRVAQHRSNGRPFDQVFYIATLAGQRERLEATLIRAINPAQNRVHRNGPANDDTSLTAGR